MPTYLVRLAQIHESFRKAELHALAELAGVELEIVSYDDDVGTSYFFVSDVKISATILHFKKLQPKPRVIFFKDSFLTSPVTVLHHTSPLRHRRCASRVSWHVDPGNL